LLIIVFPNFVTTLKVPDSQQLGRGDLGSIMNGQDAAALTESWLESASAFEAEVVKKLVRDISAKLASRSPPPGHKVQPAW
jgi:hypothetical protein